MKFIAQNIWSITKQSFSDFIDNKVLKLSAALAFYTIFSLPAMLIIVISVSNIFYGREAIEGTLYNQIAEFVGTDAALQIQQTIRGAALSESSYFATVVGIITLLFGATSVFSEIQDSINHIWKLKSKPKGTGFLKMLFNRLLSFSLVISLGFLLLVSLLINGLMDILITRLTSMFPELTVIVVYTVNVIITFGITALLFALIFKVLPDARIKWRHVRAGAITTAILFMLGKFLIGYYLGHSKLSSTYGTAGSVIVMLLWVYYSAMILYFGAVFTHVFAVHTGSRIYPSNYAVWVQEIEVESSESIQQQPEEKTVVKTQDMPPEV
ncbi:MAG: YihY/virulence factor BrkB family protein [Chitinophagaceae bacterium]|nr:YihY/virulence factor BrkB family protein [Chitinophagaceae bacterium]MBK7305858.1 YihY/virulence factor BrkB family protein [Chitinophagaceae bacterium]MBK8786404.1 YihY/virulence factor BrkB family protein [Chitinophagaceae bacterium]MBL0198699.1 YihY/virulence factor BrkB family protein [Chitinophagaceae bacterium]